MRPNLFPLTGTYSAPSGPACARRCSHPAFSGCRGRSAGANSPVDCWLERGRVPGECGGQQDLVGDAHSVSRCGGLLLVCTLGGFEQLRRRPPPAADEVKQTVFPCVMIAFSAIKCRGSLFAVRFGRCRYAARRRSQRRRPAQGALDDAGTATRTVPAVRDTSVLAELLFKTRVQQGLMIC